MKFTQQRTSNFLIVIWQFVMGIRFGYPLCCVVAFCLNRSFEGVIVVSESKVWRPCHKHVKHAISREVYEAWLNRGI